MSENRTEKGSSKDKQRFVLSRKRLAAAVVIVALAAVFAGVFVYAGTYSRVYPNTYIGNTKVSGLTYDSLKEIIDNDSDAIKIPHNLSFELNGDSISVSSEEISLNPDTDKTATLAMGSRAGKGFFKRAMSYFGSLFKKTEINPEFKYDEEKLGKIISDFAEKYETPPADASYEINGDKLTIIKGHSGKTVDMAAMYSSLQKSLLSGKSPAIKLSLISAEGEELDLDKFYAEITSPAADAYYTRLEDGSISVVPERPQIKVSKDAVKKALASDKEKVTLTVKTAPANVTKADLESKLFCGTMGSWTSYFTASNKDRTTNVALSASRINGKVLLPGETFSYDNTVGPRTTQNGFKSAGVYINNKVEQGIGGGICQTSSTLYSAVLYANLEIVTRTSHSLPVSYMPAGQDATISEGAIDFKFRNNTNYPVKISAYVNGGSVTCSIIGTPVAGQKVVINNTTTAVYEPKIEVVTDPSIPVGYKKTVIGSKGSAVSSTRTVYQNGEVVKTEKLTRSVYNSTPTTVTVNPDDKNTAVDSLTEYSAKTFAPTPQEQEINSSGEATNPEETEETEETEKAEESFTEV